MRITRLFESSTASSENITQERFVEIVAKHKALLLQSDEGSDPFSFEDFANFTEGLRLEKYECEFVLCDGSDGNGDCTLNNSLFNTCLYRATLQTLGVQLPVD